jgi:hypothetical protein
MTTDQNIIKARVGLLELGRQTGKRYLPKATRHPTPTRNLFANRVLHYRGAVAQLK